MLFLESWACRRWEVEQEIGAVEWFWREAGCRLDLSLRRHLALHNVVITRITDKTCADSGPILACSGWSSCEGWPVVEVGKVPRGVMRMLEDGAGQRGPAS